MKIGPVIDSYLPAAATSRPALCGGRILPASTSCKYISADVTAFATSCFFLPSIGSAPYGASQPLIHCSETLYLPMEAFEEAGCHETTRPASIYSKRELDARTSNPSGLRTTPGPKNTNL
jgi:hypothetical protein